MRWLVRGDGLAFLGGPWFDDGMSAPDRARVVSATLEIAAPAQAIFELIADPALQPQWDGNDNLGSAEPGQRVRGVDDAFRMTLRSGAVRENRVVEFEEGRRIAWLPAEVGTNRPVICGVGSWSRSGATPRASGIPTTGPTSPMSGASPEPNRPRPIGCWTRCGA